MFFKRGYLARVVNLINSLLPLYSEAVFFTYLKYFVTKIPCYIESVCFGIISFFYAESAEFDAEGRRDFLNNSGANGNDLIGHS
jgi:hypothetical protein